MDMVLSSCNCADTINLAKPPVHQAQEFRGFFVKPGPLWVSGFALGDMAGVTISPKGVNAPFYVKVRCQEGQANWFLNIYAISF